MPDIVETLAQRGSAYGDFREQGRITQNLKKAMQDSPNWHRLPAYMKEGLDMIQHKVSRMLNGDAYYDDNMHDIIGYTKLMQDRAAQDRDDGIKFEVGGDPLYPTYEHEFAPIRPTLELYNVASYEERLDYALGLLAELGFRANDDGGITNATGESVIAVAANYGVTQDRLLEGFETAVAPKAIPEDEEEIRVVKSSGAEVPAPAFMHDPVRDYYDQKHMAAAAPEKLKSFAGKVAWAYTFEEAIANSEDRSPETLQQLVLEGRIELSNVRLPDSETSENQMYALGAFEIPKR